MQQLQAALRASELERARQEAELEVVKVHLPRASLPHSGAISGGLQNGNKVRAQHLCGTLHSASALKRQDTSLCTERGGW